MIPFEYLVYAYLIYGTLIELVTWDFFLASMKAIAAKHEGVSGRFLAGFMVFALVISIVIWPIIILASSLRRANKKLKLLEEGTDLDDLY